MHLCQQIAKFYRGYGVQIVIEQKGQDTIINCTSDPTGFFKKTSPEIVKKYNNHFRFTIEVPTCS